MTAIEAGGRVGAGDDGRKILGVAARSWLITAFAGQLIFAFYVVALYGGSAARGDLEVWNRRLPHGIIAGDPVGNIALAIHLALAAVITVGGPLQLMPRIRARAPRFHRWNGRVYLVTALTISLAGLYIVWTRGVPGGLINAVAISLNGLLIIAFAALTLRNALARNLEAHRRWALRLFLVVNGVWFFRIGMMFWIIANQGPRWVGKDLDGPFAVTLAFAQYVAPLAILELYFLASRGGGVVGRRVMAGGLFVLTAMTAGGIAAATAFMWLPRI